MNREGARAEPDVVTGTFQLNNQYASVLFDTGATCSFVSKTFSQLIDLNSCKMSKAYAVELANGKVIGADEIITGCTLNLDDHLFYIDLMPIKLGSFDIVVGMDWMAGNKVEIVSDKRLLRIHLPSNQVLKIYVEKLSQMPNLISCVKASKCL
jgi:hypothetical protein